MRVHRSGEGRRLGRIGAGIVIAALCVPAMVAGVGCGLGPRSSSGLSGASITAQAPGPALSARRALATAREALVTKDLAKALHYYEVALAGSGKPDDRRSEALFGSGMLLIDPDPGVRDTARARARLEELARLYPGESFHVGAIVALDLIAETDRLQSEVQKLRDDGEKAEARWKKEREELQGKAGDSAKDAQKYLEESARQRKAAESLQEVVAGNEAELGRLRADLNAKDEALKKALRTMKGALVRQGATPAGTANRKEAPK